MHLDLMLNLSAENFQMAFWHFTYRTSRSTISYLYGQRTNISEDIERPFKVIQLNEAIV